MLDFPLPEGASRAGLGAVQERRRGVGVVLSAEARWLEAGAVGPQGLRGVLPCGCLRGQRGARERGMDLLLPGLLVSDGAFDWGDFSLE